MGSSRLLRLPRAMANLLLRRRALHRLQLQAVLRQVGHLVPVLLLRVARRALVLPVA